MARGNAAEVGAVTDQAAAIQRRKLEDQAAGWTDRGGRKSGNNLRKSG